MVQHISQPIAKPRRPLKPLRFTLVERLLTSLVVSTAKSTKSIPNLEGIVWQVRESQAWDFTSKEGLCQYSNAVVVALHAADPDFGHLLKVEAQNHCVDPMSRLCAVDVALYRSTGQIIDFIVSAGYGTPPPPNDVCWHEGPVGEYGPDSWFAPVADATSGSGGETPDDSTQLDRIEAMLTEQKLLLSNMNEQLALQGGEVNQIRAHQNPPYEGQMVRDGRTLTLNPQS